MKTGAAEIILYGTKYQIWGEKIECQIEILK
jgi:hypothetical protein